MTPERFNRIQQVLNRRQPDLRILVENVHKPHNMAAIVRTCDAVGVHYVHSTWTSLRTKLAGYVALGSQHWVKSYEHPNIVEAIGELKTQGMQIVATCLSDKAVDFREVDYTQPTVIMMGQEKYGLSKEAEQLADKHIIIPMIGMVQSLNVSVAAALTLYEAQRQRDNAGMYQRQHCLLPYEEQQRIWFEGGHQQWAAQCRRLGVPYPTIDANGEIVADEDWWQKLRQGRQKRV